MPDPDPLGSFLPVWCARPPAANSSHPHHPQETCPCSTEIVSLEGSYLEVIPQSDPRDIWLRRHVGSLESTGRRVAVQISTSHNHWPPQCWCNGLVNGVGMMAVMKAVQGTKAWYPSPKLTLLVLPPCLSTTETDAESLIVQESSRRPTSHIVALDYIRPLPPWKGQQFILTKIDMFCKCGFIFPACINLVSTLIQGLTEYLIHWHGTSHILSLQIMGPNLWKEGFSSGHIPVWFTNPATSHIIQELLAQESNGMALRDTAEATACGDDTLQRWSTVLPDAGYILKQSLAHYDSKAKPGLLLFHKQNFVGTQPHSSFMYCPLTFKIS